MGKQPQPSVESVTLGIAMTLQIEHVDVRELLDEEERDRRADEEALRSGRKTREQLKRKNEVFALPPDRIRINLDSAHSLS